MNNWTVHLTYFQPVYAIDGQVGIDGILVNWDVDWLLFAILLNLLKYWFITAVL